MPLGPGARLGPYEIVSAIGAGGMGEVYRARDTRLQRDVAVKVLPDAFAADPDRLARFEREAQLLASLNHPHIGAIYGLEDRALILELVEGETLADRIARGPIPLDEAIAIARQVAEALEAAHEQGVIHRDLKPSNIKITPDGTVKVLDFGLAKLNEAGGAAQPSGASGGGGLSMSPTITSPMMTGIGVLLGTAAYMAPEQAKGRPADKRSDIWAFGCVLYEMLTGKRAFEGEDVSDTLAAVLRAEPDWNSLPATVSPRLRAVIQGCIEKDRKRRTPDISAARYLMVEAFASPAPNTVIAPTATGPKRVWQAAAAVLFALATIVGATAWWLAPRPTPRVTRFLVYPPENTNFVTTGRPATSVAISPDGTKLAFTARDNSGNLSGKVQIWIRSLDALTAQPLIGTDGATHPFWSPDSRFIGYFAGGGKLMKVSVNGGPPQTLSDTGVTALGTTINRGGSWASDGTILFAAGPGKGLARVSSAGGQPSDVLQLAKGTISYVFPWFLPDGRHFLFYAYGTSDDAGGVYVGSLDGAGTKRLTGADTAAVYDSRNGYLLFVRQGTLLAQPFDPNALQLTGESFPIAERVEAAVTQGIASFSVSTSGVLAYGIGGAAAAGLQLHWIDRHGKDIEAIGPAANYRGIDLAPDGKRIAAHRHDVGGGLGGGDVWVTDLSRKTTSRFTFDASQENSSPIWSPDGTRIAYASFRNGRSALYVKAADNAGAEQRVFELEKTIVPMSWSRDGSAIIYEVADGLGNDLWMLPLTGDRKPVPLLNTPFSESHGQISPDGKWLAYSSNETGRAEIYVQPFPSGPGKWQISTNGGSFARWRPDGGELFYMSQPSNGSLMAVDVRSNGSTFEAGAPKELFPTTYVNLNHTGSVLGAGPYHTYAVSADGQRFLIPLPPSSDTVTVTMPIAVVENWAAGITK